MCRNTPAYPATDAWHAWHASPGTVHWVTLTLFTVGIGITQSILLYVARVQAQKVQALNAYARIRAWLLVPLVGTLGLSAFVAHRLTLETGSLLQLIPLSLIALYRVTWSSALGCLLYLQYQTSLALALILVWSFFHFLFDLFWHLLVSNRLYSASPADMSSVNLISDQYFYTSMYLSYQLFTFVGSLILLGLIFFFEQRNKPTAAFPLRGRRSLLLLRCAFAGLILAALLFSGLFYTKTKGGYITEFSCSLVGVPLSLFVYDLCKLILLSLGGLAYIYSIPFTLTVTPYTAGSDSSRVLFPHDARHTPSPRSGVSPQRRISATSIFTALAHRHVHKSFSEQDITSSHQPSTTSGSQGAVSQPVISPETPISPASLVLIRPESTNANGACVDTSPSQVNRTLGITNGPSSDASPSQVHRTLGVTNGTSSDASPSQVHRILGVTHEGSSDVSPPPSSFGLLPFQTEHSLTRLHPKSIELLPFQMEHSLTRLLRRSIGLWQLI